MNIKILIVTLVLLLGCSKEEVEPKRIPLPEVDVELQNTLLEYLNQNELSPEAFVITQFQNHDLVLLGEYHRIKHDVELIHNLIPLLYRNGIYTLAIEFATREDQYLIDSLIFSTEYDQVLAEKILFNFLVVWGYQEYADIFKVAWELNQSLPEGNRKFKILGLNDKVNWNDPNWNGYQEDLWAKVILDEVIEKNEKALIYSGMHHAFTSYYQPIFHEASQQFIGFTDTRMGNHLYHTLEKKPFTIALHYPWPSKEGYNAPEVYPVDGTIDAVMMEATNTLRRVGFSTKKTPFETLSAESSVYAHGYDVFNLGVFCDGYIYQMPLSEYEGVTPIEGFIHDGNIEEARLNAPNPSFRNASIKTFNSAIKADAEINRRLNRFW